MTINGPIDQASRAINDSGQVPWDLGCTFPANGINNSGQVVGTRNGTAYLYENGTVTGLVTLGGVSSVARDINNNGLITGYDTIDFSGTYRTRAFLYDNGAVTALGTLGGDDSTHYPTSINDNGLIVGYVHFDGGDSSPFIYDGEMIDLNNLISPTSGWDLTFANDINSLGQIVGRGYIDGKFHSYLLTPVPEPGTPCTYQLVGDLDESCRVDLGDVAKLAANWLLDCIDDPADPACVTP
jgi:probable HAF family extracellular repeat protein